VLWRRGKRKKNQEQRNDNNQPVQVCYSISGGPSQQIKEKWAKGDGSFTQNWGRNKGKKTNTQRDNQKTTGRVFLNEEGKGREGGGERRHPRKI